MAETFGRAAASTQHGGSFEPTGVAKANAGHDVGLTRAGVAGRIAGFEWGCGPHHGNSLMDKKRLEYYKKKLVTRREELLRDIARTQREGREADEDPTVDLADKAANSYTKEFLFGQTHADRSRLQLVDDALARIRANTFGECISCHEELQQKRLEAVPWTRYCLACQEKQERGAL
jgi:DnaK suppressor protein